MSAFERVLAGLGISGDEKEHKLRAYADLLRFYNTRINLVSREEEPFILDRHVAHCLYLGTRSFPLGSTVVDWGTGGGLPLIPLAILFPGVRFIGVDGVEKKILAVRQMLRTLDLPNGEGWHGRAEAFSTQHSHSVSRATASLRTLWGWHAPNAEPVEAPASYWPAGLICLKGGDLADEVSELASLKVRWEVRPIASPDPYYTNKFVVSVTPDVCASEESAAPGGYITG